VVVAVVVVVMIRALVVTGTHATFIRRDGVNAAGRQAKYWHS
jgi:hypothetical protein